MKRVVKKILVVLPLLVVSFFFVKEYYGNEYRNAGGKRLLLFGVTILLFYGWVIFSVVKRSQSTFWQMLLQSSFFVYVFMVLTLTGYFILFREISYHDWWQQMIERVNRHDHVNLTFFKIFSIYKITDKQVVGNFVMLFPLGIYLPFLFTRRLGFMDVFFISLFVSIVIELLQLATSFRSADVDDVLLNTTGACMGFIFYKIASLFSENNFSKMKGEPG